MQAQVDGSTTQSWPEPHQSQDLAQLCLAAIPRESYVPGNTAERAEGGCKELEKVGNNLEVWQPFFQKSPQVKKSNLSYHGGAAEANL